MGQQQLLLVILVTIIVGIATVVAINTFSAASDNANVDAVRQDLATFASSAVGYYMKPEMLGGGGGDFAGLTFNKVAFPADEIGATGLVAVNSNGVYSFTAPAATDSLMTITAHPASRIEGPITTTATATTAITVDVTPQGLTNWSE